MTHSRLFADLARSLGIARFAEHADIKTAEALERAAEFEHRKAQNQLRRREFLGGISGVAAATAAATWLGPLGGRARASNAPRIAIVGGGLAGLVCADTLWNKGHAANVYEANPARVGGRTSSSKRFPGQVVEKGGEFIDGAHKTMLAYANKFGLVREDLNKAPGGTFYFADGQRYDESAVIDQYRALVPRLRADFQVLSSPTFFGHSDAEAALDNQDLATYLDAKAADLPLIRSVLDVAYNIEYGRETHELSCLTLLLFIHLDRCSKFRPFGVSSNERFHLVGGNDQIAKGIAAQLPRTVQMGAELTRLGRDASGVFQLYFNGGSVPELADAVVLAMPFSVLRGITLEPSLGLSSDKLRVINGLSYGTNAKTMIGFHGRPWSTMYGCDGAIYSDLPNLQNSWETSWTTSGSSSVLTDYASGDRGRRLQIGEPPSAPMGCNSCHSAGGGPFFNMHYDTLSNHADAFLADVERVLPGVPAAAVRDASGKLLVERGHWLVQKYAHGSYTANQPGYFTTMAGLEAQPAGLMKFAGEHTDSFYSSQGFMEGACLSGIRAAQEVLDDIKHGAL